MRKFCKIQDTDEYNIQNIVSGKPICVDCNDKAKVQLFEPKKIDDLYVVSFTVKNIIKQIFRKSSFLATNVKLYRNYTKEINFLIITSTSTSCNFCTYINIFRFVPNFTNIIVTVESHSSGNKISIQFHGKFHIIYS